jgi:transposase-like protein
MDSTQVFCPNGACPACGQVGQGNLTVHDRKKRRYRCTVCEKSFSERKGTPFYRLRTAPETVVIVLKLLSHGCPLQAIVFAFGLDARTVGAWLKRGGSHCQGVHEHLVEQPRPVGEVQRDEIRFKLWHQVVGWMALALEVPTRLWLAGAVSEHRDTALLRRVVEQVKRASSALGRGLLFVTDGLATYVTVIKAVFREPRPTGQPGRPPLIEWPRLHIVQVVKRYVDGRLDRIERRRLQGSAQAIEALRHAVPGGGVLNTAFIERFHGTMRSHLAALTRRTRALAGQLIQVERAMYLTGTVYNFCCPHDSLKRPGLVGGHRWLPRTPAMAAGLADHCWTMEELLTYRAPPPRWRPPKKPGRPSRALKTLMARWGTG